MQGRCGTHPRLPNVVQLLQAGIHLSPILRAQVVAAVCRQEAAGPQVIAAQRVWLCDLLLSFMSRAYNSSPVPSIKASTLSTTGAVLGGGLLACNGAAGPAGRTSDRRRQRLMMLGCRDAPRAVSGALESLPGRIPAEAVCDIRQLARATGHAIVWIIKALCV